MVQPLRNLRTSLAVSLILIVFIMSATLSGVESKALDHGQWSLIGTPEESVELPGGVRRGTLSIATSILDSNAYIAAGGLFGLYESRDYGLSWQSIRIPDVWPYRSPSIEPVSSVSIGGCGYLYAGRDVSPVAVSRDYGSLWYGGILELNAANGRQAGMMTAYPFSRHVVASSKDGRIAYASLHRGVGGGPEGMALTEDGGVSWRLLDPSPAATIVATSPVEVGGVVGMEGSTLLYSSDFGRTFSEHSVLPSVQGGAAVDSVVGIVISVEGMTWWAATQGGEIMRSVDGGKTWSHMATAPNDTRIRQVVAGQMGDESVLVLTEEGELWLFKAH